MAIYTLGQHNQVMGSGLTALAEVEHYKETIILGSDRRTYRRFPLLCVLDGTEHEMWLTMEQCNTFTPREAADHGNPDPRVFELARIGMKAPKRATKEVQGWTSPHSTLAVCQDRQGGWWAGFARGSEAFARPYCVTYKRKLPEVKFLYPNVAYLGDDPTNLWRPEFGGRHENRKTRLTLATRPVMEIIEKGGVWGHYFPSGRAIRNEDVARAEVEKLRERLFTSLEAVVNPLKAEINALKADLARSESLQEKAERKARDTAAMLASLKEKAASTPDEVKDTLAALHREIRIARDKQQEAEEALATARRENPGWDWSMFG